MKIMLHKASFLYNFVVYFFLFVPHLWDMKLHCQEEKGSNLVRTVVLCGSDYQCSCSIISSASVTSGL